MQTGTEVPETGKVAGATVATAAKITPRSRRHTSLVNPRPKGTLVCLPFHNGDQERLYLAELKAYIREFNLHPMKEAPVLQITSTINGSRRGDASKELKTIKEEYAPKWNEFSRFAWHVGDIRSAVITCDRLRPTRGVPVDPETMHAFMIYKAEYGVEVTKTTGEIVCWARGDRAGTAVIATGTWHNACSPRKFRVAMRMCHRLYDNCKNVYQRSCDQCIAASEVDGPIEHTKLVIGRRYRSCIECAAPRIVPTGDPTTSSIFESSYKRVEKKCLTEHDPQGCLSLSVRRVRALRQYLLSEGADQFQRLQLWTMMLIGIRCFLRCDEVASIKCDSFAIHAAEVDKQQKRVEHIALWVRGKADTEYVLLSLWRDDENTEFCPVRCVLVYLAAANLQKESYLFPNWDDFRDHAIENNKKDTTDRRPSVFERHCSYSYIRSHLKKALQECFAGDTRFLESGRVGTHTMRKTAYLFAVFAVLSKYDRLGRHVGDGPTKMQALELDDIEKAARHGSHSNSSLYFSSHTNKYEKVGPRTRHWAFHKVSPWKSCFAGVSKDKNRYEENEDWTTRTDMDICELSRWFVNEELGITAQNWDPIKALEVACNLPEKRTAVFSSFVSFLEENLTPSDFQKGKSLFDQCCLEIQRDEDTAAAKRIREEVNETSVDTTIKISRPQKQQKVSYDEQLKALNDLKSNKDTKKRQIYDAMIEILLLPRKNIEKKSKHALTKLAQTVKCVEYCLHHCYKDNWNALEATMKGTIPLGGYGKWICKSCNIAQIKKWQK